ncbi:MAG: hypothetical protein NTZ80_00285 [Patescibacteria group bacterium]|nr:hypothetical protein [Patescibacteria group bacterium]
MSGIIKICRQNSSHQFIITDQDQAFYEKIGVPHPTLCPDCNFQNRIAFRNERSLYHRKCDLSGKQIISIYSPDKPYKVYAQDEWWSDKWDPLEYGQEFDFSRTFFEQYKKLNSRTPKAAIQNSKSENCDYTNHSWGNKNCYLAIGTNSSENSYYVSRVTSSSGVIDCYDLHKCELCYECSQSSNLYRCLFCRYCQNSNDLYLCENCIGCQNCFGCINLRNKQYCIFNKQYQREDYLENIAVLINDQNVLNKTFFKLKMGSPHRAVINIGCAESMGDNLLNCKNCRNCFMLKDSEDCANFIAGGNNKDCRDCCFSDVNELQYNCSAVTRNYSVICGNLAWYTSNSSYAYLCFNSQYLFGCSSIKKGEYLILNKQYSKEEYEKLVPDIISHMKKTGEWGEFFPMVLSPFGYNETVAQEYFQLSKDETLSQGLKWQDADIDNSYKGPKVEIPDDINDVSDEIVKSILTCDDCHNNYRLIPQELRFYRKMNISVPKVCPACRYKFRMMKRNPYHLWDRVCMKCGIEIKTTYAPERQEKVYCEKCYNKTIY